MIKCKSQIYTIRRVLKTTTIDMFKDLKVGDTISVDVMVDRGVENSVYVQNVITGKVASKPFDQACRILSCFEVE